MALGYAIKNRGSFGDLHTRVVDVTLDNAYSSGGYALSPQSMGFGANGTVLLVLAPPSDGFLPEFDESTGKLKIRDASGAAGVATPEVANSLAALAGLVVRCLALGKGQG